MQIISVFIANIFWLVMYKYFLVIHLILFHIFLMDGFWSAYTSYCYSFHLIRYICNNYFPIRLAISLNALLICVHNIN
jgi:hypothetical protein